jgi:hypothetical protein
LVIKTLNYRIHGRCRMRDGKPLVGFCALG